MQVTVNEECIACGLCEASASDIFEISDDNVAVVIVDEIPEELEEDVQDAADNCPVGAIEIE